MLMIHFESKTRWISQNLLGRFNYPSGWITKSVWYSWFQAFTLVSSASSVILFSFVTELGIWRVWHLLIRCDFDPHQPCFYQLEPRRRRRMVSILNLTVTSLTIVTFVNFAVQKVSPVALSWTYSIIGISSLSTLNVLYWSLRGTTVLWLYLFWSHCDA